jgi:hypothetical protein
MSIKNSNDTIGNDFLVQFEITYKLISFVGLCLCDILLYILQLMEIILQ